MNPLKGFLWKDMQNISKALGFVLQSDRKLCLLQFAMIVLQSLIPLTSLYLIQLLVDALTPAQSGDTVKLIEIVHIGGYFCGLYLLSRIINIVVEHSGEVLSQKLINHIGYLMHEKAMRLDLASYDNSAFHDTFHRAQQEAGHRPIQILKNITGILQGLLSLIGTIAVLYLLSPWIIAVISVAFIPALIAKMNMSGAIYAWHNENTALFRKAYYLSGLITNRVFAKELRIFNLGPYFQKAYNSTRKKLVEKLTRMVWRKMKLSFVSTVFEAGALFSILLYLGQKSLSGAITLGSFVMFLEAFRKSQAYILNVISNFSGLNRNKLFLSNLFVFLELKQELRPQQNRIPFPRKIKKGITFKNVSFSYSGSEKMVIDNFSFEARVGEITYIRGGNGVGKTTIIKLLCRLYECEKGAVYLDDLNLKDFDLTELRGNLSVLFQDFVKYEFSVRENIEIGMGPEMEDENTLRYAARMSGAHEIIEQLPNSYETVLGKYFENGEELSMGEWQKVALARAIRKNAPILILDEPTSWMDEKSENDFFERLNELRKNRVLIVISHTPWHHRKKSVLNREIGQLLDLGSLQVLK